MDRRWQASQCRRDEAEKRRVAAEQPEDNQKRQYDDLMKNGRDYANDLIGDA